jgi:hypothetical protein
MSEVKIQFGIKEIKELEFFVNEDLHVSGPFDFNHNITISTDGPQESVSFIILINYFLAKTQTPFMRSKTVTVFGVKDLKSLSKVMEGREVFDIPDQLLVTMFSISFSHARALLARSSAGTKYSKLLIPLINPDQELRRLFGQRLEKMVDPPVEK